MFIVEYDSSAVSMVHIHPLYTTGRLRGTAPIESFCSRHVPVRGSRFEYRIGGALHIAHLIYSTIYIVQTRICFASSPVVSVGWIYYIRLDQYISLVVLESTTIGNLTMAGLTQRKSTAIGSTKNVSNGTSSSFKTTDDHHSSNGDSSHNNSNNGGTYPNGVDAVKDSNNRTSAVPTAANSKGKTLKERSEIPYSFYVTFGTIISLQFFGGLYGTATLRSWYTSLYESIITLVQLVRYSQTIIRSPPSWSATATTAATTTWNEYLFVLTIWAVVILPLVYVFFIAPFRAGFWTGRKSNRHMFHRYMGLCYLVHYVLAWIEFFTNPKSSQTSYLCHIIAVMGNVYIIGCWLVSICRLVANELFCFCFTIIHHPSIFVQASYKVHRPTFRSRYCPN